MKYGFIIPPIINGVIELLSNNRLRTDKIKLRRFAVQLYFAGEVER
jgi:hypothetical protein